MGRLSPKQLDSYTVCFSADSSRFFTRRGSGHLDALALHDSELSWRMSAGVYVSETFE
jgi:hypothetical protein